MTGMNLHWHPILKVYPLNFLPRHGSEDNFPFFEKAIMDSIYPLVVTEAVAGAACRHPFTAQWVQKCLNL